MGHHQIESAAFGTSARRRARKPQSPVFLLSTNPERTERGVVFTVIQLSAIHPLGRVFMAFADLSIPVNELHGPRHDERRRKHSKPLPSTLCRGKCAFLGLAPFGQIRREQKKKGKEDNGGYRQSLFKKETKEDALNATWGICFAEGGKLTHTGRGKMVPRRSRGKTRNHYYIIIWELRKLKKKLENKTEIKVMRMTEGRGF